MFYKFEIFFSFPLTATFGKKDYKVNEFGTKQPFYWFCFTCFPLLEPCEHQFMSFEIVYTHSNYYL